MPTTVVVGSNRGIGLELCKQLVEKGHRVVATCRVASDDLRELDVEVVEGVDVRSDEAVAELAKHLDEPIDWLLVVAGVLEQTTLDRPQFDTVEKLFSINAVGPLRVTAALRDKLGDGAKVGLVTSRMGSIEDNTSGGSYAYRMSKAALNAAGKSLANDLEGDGVAVRLLHPGYVRTDMTNNSGHIDPDEAAKGLIARMEDLSLESTGEFWHQNGEQLPW